MTLRHKTLLIISFAIIIFSAILVLSANTVLLGGFLTVETREAEFNLSRAVNAIQSETDTLDTFLEDWAASDDTYRFVANANSEYIRKNITVPAFLSQKIHFMVFIDPGGNIVHGTQFDADQKSFHPLPEAITSYLKSESALLPDKSRQSVSRGVHVIQGTPLLVAARPIQDGHRKNPPRGIIIAGRFLNEKTLAKISESTRLSILLKSYADPSLPDDFAEAAKILSPEKTAWIDPIDETRGAGYALLQDIYGKPSLILRVDSPRFIYLQGKKAVQYFLLLLLAFGLLFGTANLFLLEKTILARLSSLSRQVFTVGEKNAPSLRVQVSGQDELSQLADSINTMLGSWETSQNELKESETATRALLEGMPDLLLRVDRSGMILDFKTARDRVAATPAKLLSGNSIVDAYPPPMAEKLSSALDEAFETFTIQRFEHEMVINNQLRHQEVRITPINQEEAIAILRDFTERKRLEKSLEFFNLRDSLTGLFNRTYWEEKLVTVSQIDEAAVGILVCEIDEMKLIQDSLGQEHGNNLLIAATAALRAGLPLEAVIARIGPEEFAILLVGASESDLEKIARKIRQETERGNAGDTPLHFSLSLGFASGIPAQKGIQELIKMAQSRLHRRKLSHSQTSRNNLFKSLQTALETRDFVTHQHATRLWALGKSLASEAGVPLKRMRDFKLLTQFHDIGKVGVPDEIIFKQAQLTADEMKHMMQHVEIGHRISQSIPELYPIADLLLKHHEWWNGEGYPLGLRGEEIPLECRIFSIVDAYDAMTNDRPDRKALSVKEAAAELRRCAGSQFDPHLVAKFLTMIGQDS